MIMTDLQTLAYTPMATDAAVRPLAEGEVICFSAPSPHRRGDNQDDLGIFPINDETALLVVADGLGGVRSGEIASRIVVDSLRYSVESLMHHQRLNRIHDAKNASGIESAIWDESSKRDSAVSVPISSSLLRSTVLDGVEQANLSILSLGLGAASTAALVEVRSGVIRPYHVGDSLILVTGQRGKIKLQTVSHSPIGFALESGMIDESEAMHHEERHLVSNVIGSHSMRIEIGPELRLAPRDTLLIASDGLTDNLSIDEIVEHIRKGPLGSAMRQLVDQATRRMISPAQGDPSKPDDMTIVLYRPRRTRRR